MATRLRSPHEGHARPHWPARRARVPGFVAGHDVKPLAGPQPVLEIGTRAEPARRVEEVGRDSVRPVLRVAAVEAQQVE